jgi:hypothetical protein
MKYLTSTTEVNYILELEAALENAQNNKAAYFVGKAELQFEDLVQKLKIKTRASFKRLCRLFNK